MNLFIAFAAGYLLALVLHRRLIKRIADTYEYVTKYHYTLPSAWRSAGRTIGR